MKSLIELKTGNVTRVDDKLASKLVDAGTHQYISKSEFKQKPYYMGAGMSKWIDVKSSNIHSIQYFKNDQIMRIKFGQPSVTACYAYDNIPEDLFWGMVNADSKGHYFWEYIRRYPDKYPYRRLW